MKTIAILWNSMENNFLEALKDIEEFSIVHDCFKINFNDNLALKYYKKENYGF